MIFYNRNNPLESQKEILALKYICLGMLDDKQSPISP